MLCVSVSLQSCWHPHASQPLQGARADPLRGIVHHQSYSLSGLCCKGSSSTWSSSFGLPKAAFDLQGLQNVIHCMLQNVQSSGQWLNCLWCGSPWKDDGCMMSPVSLRPSDRPVQCCQCQYSVVVLAGCEKCCAESFHPHRKPQGFIILLGCYRRRFTGPCREATQATVP